MLAALNTHYENATGETFRKIGKTDIQIEKENVTGITEIQIEEALEKIERFINKIK